MEWGRVKLDRVEEMGNVEEVGEVGEVGEAGEVEEVGEVGVVGGWEHGWLPFSADSAAPHLA